MKNPRVSNNDFVRAWMASSSHRETAEATGMPEGAVKARGTRLRRLGVKLPKRSQCTDVAALNALIGAER